MAEMGAAKRELNRDWISAGTHVSNLLNDSQLWASVGVGEPLWQTLQPPMTWSITPRISFSWERD
jgi:hypothetical protein